jgi:hypothetical protein
MLISFHKRLTCQYSFGLIMHLVLNTFETLTDRYITELIRETAAGSEYYYYLCDYLLLIDINRINRDYDYTLAIEK